MAQPAPSTPMQAITYLQQLDFELRQRAPEIELCERYFEGIHRLQFATSRFRQTFGNLFHEFADNWMTLIVDASVERLNIQGFRFDSDNAKDAAYEGDSDAWEIWRDNQLESQSDIAHTEAVKLGKSYVLVDPHDLTDLGNPTITVEHPSQAIVACVAGNRKRRKAGMKEWTDHSGFVYANVFMPDGTYQFQTTQRVQDKNPAYNFPGLYTAIYGDLFPMDYMGPPAAFLGGGQATWVPRQDGSPFFIPHDLGVVPLLPLENNPNLKVGGRSDILPIIPIQDALNKLVMDMIIASEFAAFGQRWATGIEIPKDPETGRPISDQRFLAAVSRLWTSEDPETKFGQFAASDLGNYVKAIEMFIQHVAATTRTPPHYLLGQAGSFPSGDSLAATETGLVAKVKRKMKNFSPTWEEALRLAFRVKGDARGSQQAEAVWADPEQRIRAARIDGAVKMSTLGVPQDAIWEELGASPSQIARWHKMRQAMGIAEYGPEFAPPAPEPTLLGPDGKPLPGAQKNTGPEGNLVQQQAVSQAVRVARVHD
ncbi:MAG: phage portal protein [Mycobacteriaceae bacterium]